MGATKSAISQSALPTEYYGPWAGAPPAPAQVRPCNVVKAICISVCWILYKPWYTPSSYQATADLRSNLQTYNQTICICVKCRCFSCKNESHSQKKEEEEEADFLDIMLAVFLPPVAIYKKQKRCTAKLWVNMLLTLSGIVPGSIHAAIFVTN
ncbi:uncharacterized protein LOC120153539 [Hibiscus syriacus]|uniref:uncharacterized protein LOC120153539 n=1 Tax=Hibiscus syriacus TaxID=106335 RepID=UPI00192158A3|nr:uncharacterized protein LOC120153539 [Hibiscus syriacus]